MNRRALRLCKLISTSEKTRTLSGIKAAWKQMNHRQRGAARRAWKTKILREHPRA